MATTATRFDAVTDRASYSGGTGDPPIPASGWSAAWWVYVAVDRDDYSAMLRVHAGAGGGSTVLNIATSASGIGLSVYTVGGSIEGVAALTPGQWHYVAVSISGTTCTVYAFDAAGTLLASSGGTISASTQPTGLTVAGRSAVDTSEWFNGRLSRMRIWAAALTEVEFAAEQFAALPARTGDLWAHYPLTGADDLADIAGGHDLVAGSTATSTEDGPPLPTGVSGSALAALPALSATVTGLRTVLGEGDALLPGLSVVAVGRREVAGSVATALGELQSTAIASRAVLGEGGAALGALDARAAGRRVVVGIADATLGTLDAAAIGQRAVLGQASAVLGPLSAEVVLLDEHDIRLAVALASQDRVRSRLGARRARTELGAQR